LSAGAVAFLQTAVGVSSPSRDVPISDILAAVPPTRLKQAPGNGLVRDSALDRLRHARGQSLPDWIA
jgi:alkyldihydroxyacetonephosphate synthase